MELEKLGRLLLKEDEVTSSEWAVLVSKTLHAISRSENVQELTSFFRMGPFDFPPEVTVSTLERILELGDMSEDTLWAYATQLDLYFVKQGLYQWLFAELKRLEASGGTDEEYRRLGEEVLRRLRDTDVDG